ncbi:MAG: carboxypeptidase-like regulatory domain-containing protein [Gemmatimonadaceae bacterium]
MRLGALGIIGCLAGVAARSTAAQVPIPTATVEGRVIDRISGQMLDGAIVQLVSDSSDVRRTFTARVATGGRFLVDSVPAGIYLAAFRHPLLDSLGIESPVVRTTVRPGRKTRLDLGTPTAGELIGAICPAGSLGDSAALFLGHVRSARDDRAVPNASVSVRWTELVLDGRRVQRTTPTLEARTNAIGWFAVCNLPVGVDLLVRAASREDSSGLLLQQIPWRSIVHRELYVGPSTAPAGAGSDTAKGAERAGPSRLQGRVIGTNGQPIVGAQVRVAGARSRGVSDERGGFALAQLPAGSHTLEVLALGFVPERRNVDLSVDAVPPPIEVTMTSTKHYLDTVRVTATRGYSSDLTGFERRRKASLGRFILREDIEKRAGMFVSDYLQGIMGVFAQSAGFGQVVTMRGGDGLPCLPAVYVDRLRFGSGLGSSGDGESNVDIWAWPSDIEGIEVYTHAVDVPPEFYTASDCGAIVLWTNRGRARAKIRVPK